MITERNPEVKSYWHSRVFPSGDFSIGYCSPKKKTEKERARDQAEKYQCIAHEYETHHYGGTQQRFIKQYGDNSTKEFYSLLLGLSCPFNSHKPEKESRKRRGQKGITGYGRKIVRSAAAILQKRYGRRRLSFVTLTLPSLPKYSEEIVLTDLGGWSEIVRQVTQEFKRELIRQGGVGEIVGCIEIQEERYEKYQVVAPHVHLVFEGHKGNYDYYISIPKCQGIWERIVKNQLEKIGIEEEVNFDQSTKIQAVYKNAANYLGKYLSKGGKIVAQIIEDGKAHLLPTAWYICTSKLKKLIKLYTFPLSETDKQAVLNKDKDFIEANLYFCHPVSRIWKNQEVHFGWSGRYRDYSIEGKEIYAILL